MTVKMIIPTHYEFETGDDKPTGVKLPVTTLRDILTNAMWITYDGGVTWIVADKRVRLVGEDGSFLALDEQLDDLLANIAVLQHHIHSRTRVYPQDIRNTITLAAAGTANTFGSWTEIVPINTVAFMYMVKGITIEAVNAATSYFIQLGYSILTGSDPVTAQILGERRLLLPTPITKATEILNISASSCPANSKLWGRIKSASGAADELEISVTIIRHQAITNPIDLLTTWPWST